MTLEAAFDLTIGSMNLSVNFTVEDEVVAILGPNGAGKTTILRAIAGLIGIDAGHISLDGRVLDDPAAGVFVVPNHRPIGMVFQDYLLFPFLNVADNVAFGLRGRGVPKREARRRSEEWLGRVGLADRLSAKPGQLSGGQAQRVALARALATDPAVLLLDEPLAALDAGARIEIRAELRRQLRGTKGARLLVTHDPLDAVVLCDRVIVVEAGRITQQGTTSEISTHPRSRYVADLVGVNFYEGSAQGGTVTLDRSGRQVVVADDAIVGPVFVAVHPEAVTLGLDVDPNTSARNRWTGVVASIDQVGQRVRVRVVGDVPIVAEITPESLTRLGIDLDSSVVATFKATEVRVYSA
jgi:molybdate transport system ATP-binding protein